MSRSSLKLTGYIRPRGQVLPNYELTNAIPRIRCRGYPLGDNSHPARFNGEIYSTKLGNFEAMPLSIFFVLLKLLFTQSNHCSFKFGGNMIIR